MSNKNTLLLGTRKGLITYNKNSKGDWKYERISFLGEPVSLAFVDERSDTWWACLDLGHWGSKLHKSTDRGENWLEVDSPKYPDGEVVKDDIPASTKYLWAFAHGGSDYPERLYIGTEPGGLFVSNNGGSSFELNEALWNHPSRKEQWFGGGRDNPGIHSIVVDPRDSDHLFVGISCAGVFESLDAGSSWEPRNKGLKANFLPDPNSEIGQDPHLVVASPSNPDFLWQQNHCGIFKSENGGKLWTDVSQKKGTAYFGFAISVDENDPKTAWVAPAIDDETRVAVDGSLCICRTENGGESWTDLRNGLPQENTFDLVYRHAMDITKDTLAFGTTTGNLYLSENRGDNWLALSNNLPMIHSLSFINS